MSGTNSNLLKDKKEKILSLWEGRCLKEVQSAGTVSALVLRNSMPLYLDHLSEALASNLRMDFRAVTSRDRAANRIGKLHGSDRASSGTYALTEVMYEYHILREVIFEVLEEDGTLGHGQRDIILDSIEKAVNNAAVEFSEIQLEIEQELVRSLELERFKLDSLFRQSNAAMALWRGPEFIFELVNPVYQSIFSGRELLGKGFVEALPEMEQQEFPHLLKKVYETGEPFVGKEVVARIRSTANGPMEDRYYDFTCVRVDGPDGKPYGVYDHAIDVTDRILARRDLEISKAELQKSVQQLSEESEIRERFVATLTHDLRTPMTAAKMNAQLLSRKPEDQDAVRRLSRRVISNLDRTERMISDLLDANRINAGEGIPVSKAECQLDQIIESTVEELKEQYQREFQVQIEAVNTKGYWDGESLRRVIENLASNAVKYGSTETPVTIGLTRSNTQGENWVDVTVHNEGQVIPQVDQASLFQNYHRTDSAIRGGQKGWGIGLSLVKGIAEAHGGKATVESDPGHGTTFHVRLPMDNRKLAS